MTSRQHRDRGFQFQLIEGRPPVQWVLYMSKQILTQWLINSQNGRPPCPIVKQQFAHFGAPCLPGRRVCGTLGWLTLHQAPTEPENEVSWPVKYLLNATSVYEEAGDEFRGAP